VVNAQQWPHRGRDLPSRDHKGAVALRSLTVAALFVVFFVLGSSAWGQGKGGKKESKKETKKAEEKLYVEDELTPALPKYKSRLNSYFKAHPFHMTRGTTYTIDLMRDPGPAGVADPYMFLENPAGIVVAQDDDGGGYPNARIVFAAAETGTYKIIATSFGAGMTGRYTLVARPGGVVGGAPFPGGGFMPGGSIPAPMPAPEKVFGDIFISAEPLPMTTFSGSSNEVGHGYVEYRFTLRNQSATDTHRVTLTIPKRQGYAQGPYLRLLSRSVEVGPNATVVASLLQPDLTISSGGGMVVMIDGEEAGEINVNLHQNRGRHTMPFYGGTPSMLQQVLTGEGLLFRLNNTLARTPGVPMGIMGAGRSLKEPPVPPARWSSTWLAYTSYDGIVLQGGELDKAPPPVREALWSYVESGGSLTVLGKARLPESWQARQEQKNGLTCYFPGLGECLVSSDEKVEMLSPEQVHRMIRSWDESARPWMRMQTVSDANRSFPVVEDLTIPVFGLFVLMLLFAIGIGPVNLYVLTRKKRRIWMLWTVPAIALVTCLAVLGYMVVSEGWRGHTRVEGLTILDEASHRASTIGWIGFYTPVAPSAGLHFSADTELTPQLGSDRYSYRRTAAARTLDWTKDQHLASGWVTARVPAYFKVRKSESRRERVGLHREKDGSLTAVNLLGTDISQLWLADRDGKLYGAGRIPAGGKAALAVKGTVAGTPAALRAAYNQDWLGLYGKLTARPGDYLMPGSYLAALQTTPFLEEAMPGASAHNSRALVVGIMKEGGDES
jgi:hypothetical protein